MGRQETEMGRQETEMGRQETEMGRQETEMGRQERERRGRQISQLFMNTMIRERQERQERERLDMLFQPRLRQPEKPRFVFNPPPKPQSNPNPKPPTQTLTMENKYHIFRRQHQKSIARLDSRYIQQLKNEFYRLNGHLVDILNWIYARTIQKEEEEEKEEPNGEEDPCGAIEEKKSEKEDPCGAIEEELLIANFEDDRDVGDALW
jgi:hypothetical protein